MLAAGAIGTLLGGRLADRHGFRPAVVLSLLAVLPLAFLLPNVGVVPIFVLMVAIGIAMDINFYPLVVLATNAVPRHLGFAAGVAIGFSISVGAGAAALLGLLADHTEPRAALWAAAGLAALAFVLSLRVRQDRVVAGSTL
jgi:FSR family fosmidomycin resistance protein-like MFS transporter